MGTLGEFKIGDTAYVVFTVLDATGARVTGLVNGNFTKYLTLNEAHNTQTVTVTEISAGNQPGVYKASWTANATGRWGLDLDHATYGTWQAHLEVRKKTFQDLVEGAFKMGPYSRTSSETYNSDNTVNTFHWQNADDAAYTVNLVDYLGTFAYDSTGRVTSMSLVKQ